MAIRLADASADDSYPPTLSSLLDLQPESVQGVLLAGKALNLPVDLAPLPNRRPPAC